MSVAVSSLRMSFQSELLWKVAQEKRKLEQIGRREGFCLQFPKSRLNSEPLQHFDLFTICFPVTVEIKQFVQL